MILYQHTESDYTEEEWFDMFYGEDGLLNRFGGRALAPFNVR